MDIKKELISRLKTLGWSALWVVVAMAVDFLATNIGLFNLSPEWNTVIGLILAQVSKFVHNKRQSK